MAAVENIFYIIIFISCFGGIFSVFLAFVQSVLRLPVPFWVSLTSMLMFTLPIVKPGAYLISPEETIWVSSFHYAARVWIIGCMVSIVILIVKVVIAHRFISKCNRCDNKKLLRIFADCIAQADLQHTPVLLIGNTTEPVFVLGSFKPYVVINQDIIAELEESEITIIFTHELVHIQRRHLLLQKVYTVLCAIQWANPVIWISRSSFNISCEIDCDKQTLTLMNGRITPSIYANTIFELLKSTAYKQRRKTGNGILDYFVTKQRFGQILGSSSRQKRLVSISICSVLIVLVLCLSILSSSEYFYPFPALSDGTAYEYSSEVVFDE